MACGDQFLDDSRTYEACGAGNEYTHIFLLILVGSSFFVSACDGLDTDDALTRLASRAEALMVISRHSRFEAGRPLIATSSCSQSSAESFACSDPNNSLTALETAANS